MSTDKSPKQSITKSIQVDHDYTKAAYQVCYHEGNLMGTEVDFKSQLQS